MENRKKEADDRGGALLVAAEGIKRRTNKRLGVAQHLLEPPTVRVSGGKAAHTSRLGAVRDALENKVFK